MDLEFFILLAVFIPILIMYVFMVRFEHRNEEKRIQAARELATSGQLPGNGETKL